MTQQNQQQMQQAVQSAQQAQQAQQAVQQAQDIKLVLDTLKEALEIRKPVGLILHSDQGSVDTSYAFQNLAKEKALPQACLEKETAMIMPSSHPFTPR